MEGYEIRFKVFANSQEEADRAMSAIKAFVNEKAEKGIAVTAEKISSAIERYKDSYILNSYFK